MPSYRDMLALPHDPLIGEALREDRWQRARTAYAKQCESLRRDPALTAFETGNHVPPCMAEQLWRDIDASIDRLRTNEGREMFSPGEYLIGVTGWREVHGVESLIGVPVRWFRLRDGRTNNLPVCDAKRPRLLTVSWFNDIVAYSTDEARPA